MVEIIVSEKDVELIKVDKKLLNLIPNKELNFMYNVIEHKLKINPKDKYNYQFNIIEHDNKITNIDLILIFKNIETQKKRYYLKPLYKFDKNENKN